MKTAASALCLALAFSGIAAAQPTPPTGEVPPQQQVTPPAGGEAAEEAPEKKEEIVLKPGVIASYGQAPRTTSVSVTGTGVAPGDEPSPVSGNIKQLGNEECDVVLENSSEELAFSVSYAVVGFDNRGNEAFKKTYLDSIGPKKTASHRFDCKKGLSVQVHLRSGKSKS